MPTKNRGTLFLRLPLVVVIVAVALAVAACSDKQAGADGTASTVGAEQTTGSDANPATQSTIPASTTTPAPVSSGSTSGTSGVSTSAAASSSSSSGTTGTSTASTTGIAGGGTTPATAATSTTAKPTTTTAKPTTTVKPTATTAASTTTTAPKGPVALTVTGPSGTKQLSMAELKAMPATSGYGGWKNQLGNITGPAAYTGVSLRSLIEMVGGGGSVTVVAADGYSMTISAGEAGGGVATYDPATGDALSGVAVKAIVAYAKDGGGLGSSDGPLRIAFVSAGNNQVTDSDRWVKQVIELRVN